MEVINLNLDEDNNLEFSVEIESNSAIGKASARVVCEVGSVSYLFNGDMDGNNVKVNIPSMEGKINEGTYKSKLEVVVDDKKYFTPLEFSSCFSESTKVKASIVSETSSKNESIKASIVSKPSISVVTKKKDPVKQEKKKVNNNKKLEEDKRRKQLAAEKKLAERKLAERKKKSLLKKKRLEEERLKRQKAKRLAEQKKSKKKSPDVELRELLDDLGID